MALDAWTALKALLPPPERRGVMLIDPAFEQTGELDRLVDGLKEAVRRFADGTFLLWYPIKESQARCRLPPRSRGARVAEGDGDRVDDPRARGRNAPQRRRPHRGECAVYFVGKLDAYCCRS